MKISDPVTGLEVPVTGWRGLFAPVLLAGLVLLHSVLLLLVFVLRYTPRLGAAGEA